MSFASHSAAPALSLLASSALLIGCQCGVGEETSPAPSGPPAASDTVYQLEQVLSADGLVTDIQHAGDESGRLFVVEKSGRVRVAHPSDDGFTLAETPYLDIQSRIADAGGERGLLGLAFAPDFATSGVFYVNYTGDENQTVVARYTTAPDADTVDAASEEVILEIAQPYGNHNGGQLAFGPDGFLWIGTGDGGAGGDPEDRAENPDELLGKMLRIDVSATADDTPYAIPADNAYQDAAEGRPEIWARGLRNPWRYSFDSATGDLWVSDVGQDAWEEVNHVPAGAEAGLHFGWNTLEGAHCFSPAVDCDPTGARRPDYEYSQDEGCSITGGVVVRDPALPELTGQYLIADFCNQWVRAVSPAEGERPAYGVHTVIPLTGVAIATFGVDGDGRVYAGGIDGGVRRLTAQAE